MKIYRSPVAILALHARLSFVCALIAMVPGTRKARGPRQVTPTKRVSSKASDGFAPPKAQKAPSGPMNSQEEAERVVARGIKALGESCSDDKDEDAEEDEEPKKKKAKKSEKEKRREQQAKQEAQKARVILLAKRRQPPLGSQGRLLQSSTASSAWRTNSQGRSSKSCLNSN